MPLSPGVWRRLRDRARARRDGKRDGLLGIPTRDEVAHPPALVQIARRADEALAELVRSWIGEDARLRERVGATTQELRPGEDDVRAASAEHALAEQRRRAMDESHTPSEPAQRAVGLGPRVYAVAIIAILIAEFP